jgi:hypothetical protein
MFIMFNLNICSFKPGTAISYKSIIWYPVDILKLATIPCFE